LRSSNHARVEVEGVNRVGAKDVEDELGAHPASAADLEGLAAAHGAAHAEQPPGFKAPLDRGADHVIHERVLESVENHGCFDDLRVEISGSDPRGSG
jgi:hypothetical protein